MTDPEHEEASGWVGATAKQMARAVRRGDASAGEMVADHLAHIEARESVLRAFRMVRAAEALAEADAVDAEEELANMPLAGVPIAVKENTAVAGVPTWNGSAAARTAVAEADHEVVRRLRGAGAVVVAVSREPELGLWAFTDDDEAVTRNPWRTDRTPGGSSGGAAAAVAAGLVPIAHGNDGLGSVRIPAAACGLVGIKPGRGVVPCQLGANDWYGMAEHGILATTVSDATVGLAVLAGWTPPQLVEPERLRVAVSTRSPVSGVRPDAPSRAAVASAAKLLVAAGHDAVERSPRYPTSLGLRTIATWCAAAYNDAEADKLDAKALQPRSQRHVALGRWAARHGFVRQEHRDRWRADCEAWFDRYGVDVLLTPALASSPPVAQQYSSRSWLSNMAASMRFAPYAAPWNVSGFPAITVPMGVRPDGLPVAIQLVAPPGAELRLLAVAGQLEAASPWLRHAPGWPYPSGGADDSPGGAGP
ncbi:MAG TPA: amidase family protein [Micromonosporaceae bacterium]|nr:amidase family protein [Micromonosporaceae bacterium]